MVIHCKAHTTSRSFGLAQKLQLQIMWLESKFYSQLGVQDFPCSWDNCCLGYAAAQSELGIQCHGCAKIMSTVRTLGNIHGMQGAKTCWLPTGKPRPILTAPEVPPLCMQHLSLCISKTFSPLSGMPKDLGHVMHVGGRARLAGPLSPLPTLIMCPLSIQPNIGSSFCWHWVILCHTFLM